MRKNTGHYISFLTLLGSAPPSSPPSRPPKKRPPVRHSKFLALREEILRLNGQEKSLKEILDCLKKKYPQMSLPKSRSQLSRFIRKCLSGGCGDE